MHGTPLGKGMYQGFRATGAIMQRLATLDPSVGGAVRTDPPGLLGKNN
jgi:hypothetical protein